jgi:hypothetical protein
VPASAKPSRASFEHCFVTMRSVPRKMFFVMRASVVNSGLKFSEKNLLKYSTSLRPLLFTARWPSVPYR